MEPPIEEGSLENMRLLTQDLTSLSEEIDVLLDEAVVREPVDDRLMATIHSLLKVEWFFRLSLMGSFCFLCLFYYGTYLWLKNCFVYVESYLHIPIVILFTILGGEIAVIFIPLYGRSWRTLREFRKSMGIYGDERKRHIIQAIHASQLDRIKGLLNDDPAVVDARDSAGDTILHKAVSLGNVEIIEYLLTKGANVNSRDNSDIRPLHQAARLGSADVAGLLISRGADVNAIDFQGQTALHLATRNGHSNLVVMLVSKGAHMNVKNIFGDTPLTCALSQQLDPTHAGIASYLISGGAEIDTKNSSGMTPLHLAAEQGYNKIAKILIGKNARVDARDNAGWTPLHKAVQRGNITLMEELINGGTDVNARTDLSASTLFGGWTALHFSVTRGYIAAVEILINNGADLNAKTPENSKPHGGRTPLEMAREMCDRAKDSHEHQIHEEIMNIILRHQGIDTNEGTTSRTTLSAPDTP
jgi:ankyrin repeat protein